MMFMSDVTCAYRVSFDAVKLSRGNQSGKAGRPTMKYTCTEYREEMTLLALRKQLGQNGLSDEEKKRISDEIKKLEAKMDMV
jgi:hypothetical protein